MPLATLRPQTIIAFLRAGLWAAQGYTTPLRAAAHLGLDHLLGVLSDVHDGLLHLRRNLLGALRVLLVNDAHRESDAQSVRQLAFWPS